MQKHHVAILVSVSFVLAAGCRTVEPALPSAHSASEATPATTTPSSTALQQAVPVIGNPVTTLVTDAVRNNLRMEYFTVDGKSSAGIPSDGGSVSVYHADQNGQDNYAFGPDGIVIHHMQSIGTNYLHGIWQKVN